MASEISAFHKALLGLPISILLRIIRLLLGLVLMALLNRHLGPGGAGQIMIGMAWIAPLQCMTELGFNRITVRELARAPGDENGILGTTFFTRLATGCVLFLIALVASSFFEPSIQPLLWVYMLLLPTHALSDLLLYFEAKGKVIEVTWAQFRGFGLVAVAMLVGIWLKAPPAFFAATYVLESWSAVAILGWAYHKSGGSMRQWRWSATRCRALLKESWPEMLAQMSMLVLFRVDVLMLGWMRGEVETGIYSVAVRLSEVGYFIAPLMGSVVLSQLVELKQNKPELYERRFSEYLGINLAFACLCGLGLTLAAPLLVGILGGGRFTESVDVLRIHAWGIVAYYFGIARTQYLAAEGRLASNLPAVLVGLVCSVILNLWLIPLGSAKGAALATVTAYGITWGLMTLFSRDLWPLLRWQKQGLLYLPSMLVKSWNQGLSWLRLRFSAYR